MFSAQLVTTSTVFRTTCAISSVALLHCMRRIPTGTTKRLFSSRNKDQTQIIVNNQSSSIYETLNSISRSGFNINFPKIICIGNQSAGKTSLTEAMCGINGLFDKKSGLATRRPTYISLIRSPQGDDFIKIGNLGEKCYSIEQARRRISEENAGDITAKPLEIVIYSQNIHKECLFVDLPGFINNTKNGEDDSLPKKIKDICMPYIVDSTNIKLIVMAATEDSALSYGLNLVKRNSEMQNAIAVYTKLDKLFESKDKKVGIKMLRDLLDDPSYIPKLGVIGVRLRSPVDLVQGVLIKEMLENEEKFVIENGLTDLRHKLTIPTLMDRLSGEQIKRIAYRFPTIKEEMSKSLNEKKYGQLVLQKLVETEDIHGISQELERIITDLHPLSEMRVNLELEICKKVRDHVKSFVAEKIDTTKVTSRPLHTKNETVPLMFMRNIIDRTNSDIATLNPNVFGDNLMHGECNYEMTVPALKKVAKDTIAKSAITSFVNIAHPTESIERHPRTEFMRSISNLVSSMVTSPTFVKTLVNIINSEIKKFVLQNGRTAETNEVAKLFFVHVFDKISQRTDSDGLVQSIGQMLMREQRPYIAYDELSSQMYKLVKPMMDAPLTAYPGLFSNDQYPVSVPLYSETMKLAYINAMVERMSIDCFRMIGVNLLIPIITNTIELSLKTIKNKDFKKEEDEMKKMIDTLEKQLTAVENIIVNNIKSENKTEITNSDELNKK